MRRSRYTTDVAGSGGKHLLFNAAYGTFLVADDELYNDFLAGGGGSSNMLERMGFITELTPDEELDAQQALFDAQRADSSELSLVLAPTYACNYRCPYCYEQGHNSIKGIMNDEVIEGILAFVVRKFAQKPFERMSVQWYGGDPSLALDVVEKLSNRLLSFCESHEVEYHAMMLTNCNLIDEAAVEMLRRVKIESAFVTIDGFENTHNKRRVAANGSNSFERTIQAVRLFTDYGITVIASMNVDRVNWPEYRKLRDYLKDEFGVSLNCARLCDYGHFFGTREFKKPSFDLMSHDEFCKLAHETFAEGHPQACAIESRLAPAPRFCGGQKNDYFVIDTLGDIYLCDGYIGEQDHVVGSIFDESAVTIEAISHNPYENEQCRECEIVPLCQGNCDWERHRTGMICHPLRSTLKDYLLDWQRALEKEALES